MKTVFFKRSFYRCLFKRENDSMQRFFGFVLGFFSTARRRINNPPLRATRTNSFLVQLLY